MPRGTRRQLSAVLSAMVLCCAVALLALCILGCDSAADVEPSPDDGQPSADARQYLSEEFFPGMHILEWNASVPERVQVYRGGQLPGRDEHLHEGAPFVVRMPDDFDELFVRVANKLKIGKIEDLQNDVEFFDRQGGLLNDLEEFKAAKVVFLIEVGQWMWPAVAVGFKQEVPGGNGGTATLTTLSLRPRLFRVENFMSAAETEALVSVGEKMGLDKSKVTSEGNRTTAWLHSKMSPVVRNLDDRVVELMRIPLGHQEPIQLLRYDSGGYNLNHMDWVELDQFNGNREVWVETHMGHQDRLATMFWYLNDVPEGGETTFPKVGQPVCAPESKGGPEHRQCEGTHDPPADSCAEGLKIKPEPGTAILWYNFHGNGRGDVNALHAGCRVGQGLVKWAANKFIRIKNMEGPRSEAKWVDGHPAIKRFGWKEPDVVDPNFCMLSFDSGFNETVDMIWHGDQEDTQVLGPLQKGERKSWNSVRNAKFSVDHKGRKSNTRRCRPPETNLRLSAEFRLESVAFRPEL